MKKASLLKKAAFTSVVVGTILTFINHGDILIQGEFPKFIKLVLTYLVPLCVTLWGAYVGRNKAR